MTLILIGFLVTLVALALLALWVIRRWLRANSDAFDKKEDNL